MDERLCEERAGLGGVQAGEAPVTCAAEGPAADIVADAVSDAELAALCRDRARTYGLLSRLFLHEVDGEMLERLGATLFPASTGDEQADGGAALIAGYLDRAWENTTSELAVDYARVFLGDGYDGCSAAYPYESVYTSEKHLLMQDAYAEVLAAYRAAGIVKAQGTAEVADHAGLELQFMQIMCLRAAAALEAGDEGGAWQAFDAQRAFVTDHLLRWFPALARDMVRFAQTDFYKGLGALAAGFVRSEKRLLDELAGGD